MENNKPMTLLLVEDDQRQCEIFKNFIEAKADVRLVKTTNSSDEAIEYVKTYTPEGIILDIELHKGKGSGIEFLEELKNINVGFKPIVVVTTNASSELLYDQLHNNGVDLVFYKKQNDYSPKLVINSLLALRKSLYKFNENNTDKVLVQTAEDRKAKISNKINSELDLIGISSHLIGRKYLYDAIFYLLDENKENKKETVFNYLSRVYRRSSSSISRVMQTAINYGWRVSPPEDLEAYYTAKINYATGVPTPTELMYYYADKIKRII